jgi:peptide deformylase
MALLPINVYGDKILRKKAVPVKEIDMELIEFIKNMSDTMHSASGIGLAATQVGSDKSLFVLDISVVEDYKHIKPIVMINPEILELSDDKVTIEEGCLSIPDIRKEIIRPEKVRIKYFDTNMKEFTLDADELLARVIQHEYDHLEGVLFTDKLNEASQKKLKRDLARIKSRKIETDYPITSKAE